MQVGASGTQHGAAAPSPGASGGGPARPVPCGPRRWAAAREEGEEGRRRPAAGIVSWVRLGSVSGRLAASRCGLRAPRERSGVRCVLPAAGLGGPAGSAARLVGLAGLWVRGRLRCRGSAPPGGAHKGRARPAGAARAPLPVRGRIPARRRCAAARGSLPAGRGRSGSCCCSCCYCWRPGRQRDAGVPSCTARELRWISLCWVWGGKTA